MNAFHILGGLLAVWALTVAFLGITRHGWPGSKGGERLVILISVVLFFSAVGSAVLTAVAERKEEEEHEKHEKEKGKHEEKALLLPG